MQFLITAHDGPDMLERRMRVRPRHQENIEKVKEYGTVVCTGGIMNDDGQPVGTVFIMDFATKDLLDQYLASEPYIIEKVWQNVSVENVCIVNSNKGSTDSSK